MRGEGARREGNGGKRVKGRGREKDEEGETRRKCSRERKWVKGSREEDERGEESDEAEKLSD